MRCHIGGRAHPTSRLCLAICGPFAPRRVAENSPAEPARVTSDPVLSLFGYRVGRVFPGPMALRCRSAVGSQV